MQKVQGYSNRSFLAVTIYHTPHKHVRTEKKGWNLKVSNWTQTEVPEILSHISLNKLCSAAVIIDLNKNVLVKNRFSQNDPTDILNHYKKKYVPFLNAEATESSDEEHVHDETCEHPPLPPGHETVTEETAVV
jgi:peptide deformylase